MEHELEPQQYQDIYRQEDIPLVDVRQSVLRKWMWGTIIIIAAFTTLGFTIKFPNQINVPFVFKSEQTESIYQFSYTVFLLEKKVSEKSKVEEGQTLLKITAPEIVEQLSIINQAESQLKYHLNQEKRIIDKQAEISKLKGKQYELATTETKDALDLLRKAFEVEEKTLQANEKFAKEQWQNFLQLYQNDGVAAIDVEEKEQAYLETVNALEQARRNFQGKESSLSFSIQKNANEQKTVEQAYKKLHLDYQNKIINLEEQIRLAKLSLVQNFGNHIIESDGIVLTAESSGIVSFLFSGDKEVTEGNILLKIQTKDSPLYALTEVAPQHIGQIKEKSSAILKVNSFPHYEWGTVKGKLATFPTSPSENGKYPVKIKLEDLGRLRALLQIGMTGEVALIIEEKSFFGYLTKNMKRVYYEITE